MLFIPRPPFVYTSVMIWRHTDTSYTHRTNPIQQLYWWQDPRQCGLVNKLNPSSSKRPLYEMMMVTWGVAILVNINSTTRGNAVGRYQIKSILSKISIRIETTMVACETSHLCQQTAQPVTKWLGNIK